MEEILLGTLFRWGPEGQVAEVPLEICKGDEIYIGRDVNCQYQILNSHVSGRHIHIYTVSFDEDDPDDVPLVYAENLSRYGTKWNAYMIREQGESFLLSDGDNLEITHGVTFRFMSASLAAADPFTPQQKREMKLFSEEFVISRRCLGFGAYGRVHMAYRVNDGKQLACKVIDMTSIKKQAVVDRRDKGLTEFGVTKQLVALRQNVGCDATLKAKIEACEQEAKLLAGLKHPNIVTLEAAFRCDHTLYILVELATGGDLYSFIKRKGGKVEPATVAGITLQLLLAVQFIHARNIVHRDIKPDNILTTSQKDGGRVILSDFGCARVVPEPTKRLSTLVGTKEYCAPEVFSLRHEGYTAAVDVWSVGRVTGTMLVGYSPRVEDDDEEDENGIQLLMADLASLGLDGDPADFVGQLLNPDPEKRPPATKALGHSWFANLPNKRELEQRYQQSIRGWKSKARRDHGTEPITYLTTTNPFATYCPTRRSKTTSISIAEEYTLFPGADHVSESSYGDAPPSRPQRTPLTHAQPSSNAHNRTPRVSDPVARGHNPMDQTSAVDHGALARAPPKDPQFLSQVERLHADPQLPKGNYLYFAPAELILDLPTAERHSYQDTRANETPRRAPSPAEIYQSSPAARFRLRPVMSRYAFIPSPSTEQQPADPGTPDSQGDVYEEVRNPVTGKRRRFIYGRPEEEMGGL